MRRLVLLALLTLVACGGDSQGPPDGNPPCPDQAYADLNQQAGRLDELLYRADVAQLLLLGGATERFETTVAGHGAAYSRQEIFDAATSAVKFDSVSDSLRSLLDAMGAAADSLDPALEWSPLFGRFRECAERTMDAGDSLVSVFAERERAISSGIAPLDTLGETVALACAALGIEPSFASFTAFVEGADSHDWAGLLPSFVSCARAIWADDWISFIHQAVAALSANESPLVGPIALHLADKIVGAEAGWASVETWSEGGGSVRIEPDLPGGGGTGLAILIPQGSGPMGCTYRSIFAGSSTTIPSVPAGSFRLLLFRGGARPYASAAFQVLEEETAALTPEPAYFETEACSLAGGEVSVRVIDPSNIEHISNDYDLSCRTEVWIGTLLYADTVGVPGYRIRSVGAFRGVVDCEDLSFSGEGTGTISATPVGPDGCAAGTPSPDRFTFRVGGSRSETSIFVQTRVDPDDFSITLDCPGDSTRVADITSAVLKDRNWTLSTGIGGNGMVEFPPGSTPEGARYWRMDVHRVF